MSQKSKFIALKNYIPIGLPTENDFIVKEQVIDLTNNNDVLVEVTDYQSSGVAKDKDLEKFILTLS